MDVRGFAMWQPWAGFVAEGIKWIETRSWSTSYRGRIRVLATKRPPFRLSDGGGAIIGDYVLDWGLHPDLGGFNNGGFDEGCGFLAVGTDGDCLPLFLGCFIAEADLVDVVPMVGPGSVVGPSVYVPGPTSAAFPDPADLWGWQLPEYVKGDRHPYLPWTNLTGQRPYGDFAPGRFAWLLDNVKPIDPVPAKGHQGLWKLDG